MSKIQVRKGLFETNSSSVHSLVMCSESEYEKWKNGDYVFCRYEDALIPKTNKDYQEWCKMSDAQKEENWSTYDYLTWDDFFNNYDAMEYETFHQTYDTTNGETVVAFGYYGHD